VFHIESIKAPLLQENARDRITVNLTSGKQKVVYPAQALFVVKKWLLDYKKVRAQAGFS